MSTNDYIDEILIQNVQFSRSQNVRGERGPIWAEVSFRISQPTGEDAYLVEQVQLDGEPHTLESLLPDARLAMSERLARLSQMLKEPRKQ